MAACILLYFSVLKEQCDGLMDYWIFGQLDKKKQESKNIAI